MNRDVTQALAGWIEAGINQIGEIAIEKAGAGFVLTHVAEAGQPGLKVFSVPTDARALSTYDDSGAFRPLKTAPTLRHGWRLELPDAGALRIALDAFYPAMLGSGLSQERGELEAVNLRDTLNRQSGMYAITKKLTDAQAQELVGCACASSSGCLKTILWRVSPELAVESLPAEKFEPHTSQAAVAEGRRALPLLCAEACNLLVAAARELIKKTPYTPPPALVSE